MTTIHNGLEPSLGGLTSGSADKTQAAPSPKTEHTAQSETQSGSATTGVDITPTAQLMASLEQQISSTPEVNQSRVDSIRQALSSGTYQVNSSRVADGVLAAQKFNAQASTGTSSHTKAFTSTAQLGTDQS